MGFLIRVRVFVPVSWARLYARSGAGRIWRALSYNLRAQGFEFVGEGFSPSYEFGIAPSPPPYSLIVIPAEAKRRAGSQGGCVLGSWGLR